MERYVDLHVHSRHSDGVLSPTELVAMAAGKGLRAIGLADHDAVAGIDEALEAGIRYDVEVVPAVELSVEFRGFSDVHLLGYYIDYRDPEFLDKLRDFCERRDTRGRAILEKINARLLHEGRAQIDTEEVLAAAEGALGRPHIARALMARGYVTGMNDAFKRYLEPCNVPKRFFPMDEALAEIRRIGGVAVLAHPTSITTDRSQLRSCVGELAGMGLRGIEAYNNMCIEDDANFLERIAREFGLAVTGGSDFHGIEADVEMGSGRGNLAIGYHVVTALQTLRSYDAAV
jgi:predicted metal-dependent phosphoesterase TrpH